MRQFTVVTVALSCAVSFLVGVILAGGLTPAPTLSSAPRTAASRGGSPAVAAGAGAVNFADVAERINPAVVNIDAASRGGHPNPRRRTDETADPQRDFEVPRQGSGSGFIIDRQGYILTNYHVIEEADRITVTLADGRALRAELVGSDPAIDVALIRVAGVAELPEAPLGNSDDLRVGEWVCAIGNPLGYVHSVTVGVVSFIGRKLFDASLDDYIQTDAAINFGNSGGPLINARGEVIGINAAISSRASNIGFAVPINGATAILAQLRARGRVTRGYMGVGLHDIDIDLQHSLHIPVSQGAVVQDVTEGSPAERAGIRPYDVIVGFEGQPVANDDELIHEISARAPGSSTQLRVLRDNREFTVAVKLSERPPREGERKRDAAAPSNNPLLADTDTLVGLTVRELDATAF